VGGLEKAMPPNGIALVTGGVGFIGSHLCRTLAAAGLTVHSTSRREHPGEPHVRHWQADLSDFAAVNELLKSIKPDYVFHLASHVMGSPEIKHVLPTFQGNLHTTVNLLAAVAEHGCRRFITTGSFMEPVGDPGDSIPTSPYAAAKWSSNAYCRLFRTLYNIPIATARVYMVYGPGQQDTTKLVPYSIRCLLKGEPPRITSGRRLIDWVYVEDVAAGFLRLALAPNADGLTVDIGSGSLIATVDLVNMICQLGGSDLKPVIGAIPDRPMEPSSTARIADSLRLIQWSPQVNLEEGLRRTIESYRRSKDLAG
jgi:nucleoside-diphosphate-sugar epimerase